MELLPFSLVFVMFWKPSWSMLCYKCSPDPVDSMLDGKSCEHFDKSQMYVANCSVSTMCFKRITYLNLAKGVTAMSVSRGCASQTMSGDQKKVNGKWEYVKNIYEVYGENCAEDPSDSQRITKTIHCYCRGDYCNGAHRTTTLGIFTILLGLLALS